MHDGADRILLGRQAIWPDGWYSTLAGFVEPGESLEQCVIREVHEEVGIVVCEPRYLGSQPWPFPRSLMLGFAAIGDPADELQFLDGEIGDARWFHRDEVRAALSRDGWTRVDPAPDGTPPRVDPSETGGSPAHTRDIVLGVVRDGVLHRVDDAEVEQIEAGDRLLYVRKSTSDD